MLSTLNSNVLDCEPVNKKRKRDGPSESFYVSLKTWYKIVILYYNNVISMHDINKFVFPIAFITGFEFTVNNLKALLKFCLIRHF